MNIQDQTKGASVVITHRVKPDCVAVYENWLGKIAPACRSYPGYLDWHIVRPIQGLTSTYTIVIRFDSVENITRWMKSNDRTAFINEIKYSLSHDDDFVIRSGLDFWFTPDGAKAKLPRRWKQFLVTWSAIYPLVLIVPLVVIPIFDGLGIVRNRYIDSLGITLVVVSLMVYLVMPNYTKIVKKWLFS